MLSNDKVDAIAMLNQNIFIILQGNGIEEDHKHDYSDGDIPAFGWCHTLLDVSWFRHQEHRQRDAAQDELDVDAPLVPVRHSGPGVSRLEMAADP